LYYRCRDCDIILILVGKETTILNVLWLIPWMIMCWLCELIYLIPSIIFISRINSRIISISIIDRMYRWPIRIIPFRCLKLIISNLHFIFFYIAIIKDRFITWTNLFFLFFTHLRWTHFDHSVHLDNIRNLLIQFHLINDKANDDNNETNKQKSCCWP
jgi:hypothetical protein